MIHQWHSVSNWSVLFIYSFFFRSVCRKINQIDLNNQWPVPSIELQIRYVTHCLHIQCVSVFNSSTKYRKVLDKDAPYGSRFHLRMTTPNQMKTIIHVLLVKPTVYSSNGEQIQIKKNKGKKEKQRTNMAADKIYFKCFVLITPICKTYGSRHPHVKTFSLLDNSFGRHTKWTATTWK